jgi:hypothetical protein
MTPLSKIRNFAVLMHMPMMFEGVVPERVYAMVLTPRLGRR